MTTFTVIIPMVAASLLCCVSTAAQECEVNGKAVPGLVPGKTVTLDCGDCWCDEGGYAECSGQTCDTPNECLKLDGSKLPGVEAPGDTWKSEDNCEKCKCGDDGLVFCKLDVCKALTCDSPVEVYGECCPACPETLKNACVLSSGIAIKVNSKVTLEDGTVCSCKKDEDGNPMEACKESPAAALQAQIAALEQKLALGNLTEKETKFIEKKIKKLKKKLNKLK